MFAHVVKGTDARVIQCRGGARLPLEPIERHPVARAGPRQKLDGDSPVQAGVASFLNLAHTARPPKYQNHIKSDLFAGWNNRLRNVSWRLKLTRFQELSLHVYAG